MLVRVPSFPLFSGVCSSLQNTACMDCLFETIFLNHLLKYFFLKLVFVLVTSATLATLEAECSDQVLHSADLPSHHSPSHCASTLTHREHYSP